MNNYEQATQEVRDSFNALCKGRVEAAVKAEREAIAKFIKPTEEHRRDASWGYIGGEEGVAMLDNLAASVLAGAHHEH